MSAGEPLREEDELLAAELAFGLIEEAHRDAALTRLAGDPRFAAAHARWQDYAAALLAGPDVPPRPSIWAAIVARLPANDVTPAARGAVRWWQAGTLVATAAAVILGVIAVERQPLPIAPMTQPMTQAPLARPEMIAVLTAPDSKAVVTVSYDPATGRLTAAPTGVEIGDHSAELWVIPDGQSPRSLGVIGAASPGRTRAPGPAAATIAPGALFAITVEPIGGSPTGKPSGAPILSGKVTTI